MSREDRVDLVLRFMADHELALPPRVIYRNLRLHWNATFGYSSMKNYLRQLVTDGYLRRVHPERLEDRALDEVDDGDQKAYYIITEEGRHSLFDE